jgi:hypothetical protein
MDTEELGIGQEVDGGGPHVSFEEEKSQSQVLSARRKKEAKYRVDVRDIIAFVFPEDLQHPLAAARFFVYGDYGPLDSDGNLRSGPGGSHVLSVWELDAMCSQIEREDIMQIYLHRKTDMGLLSKPEQEAMIAQADGHLKRAKGKAMLPQITPDDIVNCLDDLEKDEYGLISFHEVQKSIGAYRRDRVKEYKLVFPSIGGKKKKGDASSSSTIADNTPIPVPKKKVKPKKISRVTDIVAPPSMFMHDEGSTAVEVVETTNKFLCRHASKISAFESKNDTNVVSNVRLLRDVAPTFHDPYISKKTGLPTRPKFEIATLAKGTSLGSMVKAAASASTWKRKSTVY